MSVGLGWFQLFDLEKEGYSVYKGVAIKFGGRLYLSLASFLAG